MKLLGDLDKRGIGTKELWGVVGGFRLVNVYYDN